MVYGGDLFNSILTCADGHSPKPHELGTLSTLLHVLENIYRKQDAGRFENKINN